MKAGQLDKACGELQASLELVRDSGTKGALATCHGLAGRIATAWLLWRELADTAPSADLRADAAAHATKLEPRLPRYLIAVPTAMSDLVVEINGRRVPSHVTVAVPIDPGKVRVRAVRQDGDGPVSEDWTRDYVAVERETIAIEIPALAPLRQFGLTKVVVSTMQAVSGAGYPGVPSLDILGNVVPFIGGEEEKMEIEAQKILGTDGGRAPHAVVISAHTNRVPVLDGHTMTVSVEFASNPGVDAVTEAMRTFAGRPQELGLPSAPVPAIEDASWVVPLLL